MLGVLTKGALDDGRGKARVNLFKHKHELESGRTSSVGSEIMGFAEDGTIIQHPAGRKLNWEEICSASTKVTPQPISHQSSTLDATRIGHLVHRPGWP